MKRPTTLQPIIIHSSFEISHHFTIIIKKIWDWLITSNGVFVWKWFLPSVFRMCNVECSVLKSNLSFTFLSNNIITVNIRVCTPGPLYSSTNILTKYQNNKIIHFRYEVDLKETWNCYKKVQVNSGRVERQAAVRRLYIQFVVVVFFFLQMNLPTVFWYSWDGLDFDKFFSVRRIIKSKHTLSKML